MTRVLYKGTWMPIRRMRFLRIVAGEIKGTPEEQELAKTHIKQRVASDAAKNPKEAEKILATEKALVTKVKSDEKPAKLAPKKSPEGDSTKEPQTPLKPLENAPILSPVDSTPTPTKKKSILSRAKSAIKGKKKTKK